MAVSEAPADKWGKDDDGSNLGDLGLDRRYPSELPPDEGPDLFGVDPLGDFSAPPVANFAAALGGGPGDEAASGTFPAKRSRKRGRVLPTEPRMPIIADSDDAPDSVKPDVIMGLLLYCATEARERSQKVFEESIWPELMLTLARQSAANRRNKKITQDHIERDALATHDATTHALQQEIRIGIDDVGELVVEPISKEVANRLNEAAIVIAEADPEANPELPPIERCQSQDYEAAREQAMALMHFLLENGEFEMVNDSGRKRRHVVIGLVNMSGPKRKFDSNALFGGPPYFLVATIADNGSPDACGDDPVSLYTILRGYC